MISIIVCSTKANPDRNFEKNISLTIGCTYELIWFDNSTNNYSIFSAYNLGAAQSQYDYICFVHEDVLFETNNWGIILTDILIIPNTGVVGVAGAKVKTRTPSPWWVANGYKNDAFFRYNIIQKRKNYWIHELCTPRPKQLSEVVVLDGVILCCRRSLWEQIKFDEITFSGFHFYDLDFCMKATELGYKNFVTYGILIRHSSIGNIASGWLEAAEIFHNKWNRRLPVTVKPISKKEIDELEYQASFSFLWLLIKHQYGSVFYKIKMCLNLIIQKPFFKDSWRQLYCILKSR